MEYTPETFATDFPFLEQIGFSLEQVRKIVESRDRKMQPLVMLLKALDKCNHEAQQHLEKGVAVTAKTGESVRDLAAWYFKSLREYGDYRTPEGWVDQEMEQVRELQRIAQRLQEEQAKAQEDIFAAWRQRLSPQDVRNLVAHWTPVIVGLSTLPETFALKRIFKEDYPVFAAAMMAPQHAPIPDGYFSRRPVATPIES